MNIKTDVAFIIDVTGSMGRLLDEAKVFLQRRLSEFAATGVDLTASLILYRDHPPQDRTFASMVAVNCGTPKDVDMFMRTSRHFRADGGGDAPESGLDGIQELRNLKVRPDAIHKAFLIGDAPLHGTPFDMGGYYGKPPEKCACGLSHKDVPAILEESNFELAGVQVNTYGATLDSFSSVCSVVHKTSTSNSFATIFADLVKMRERVAWATDILLPVLQDTPYAQLSDIAKIADAPVSEVTACIEILNTLELTKNL